MNKEQIISDALKIYKKEPYDYYLERYLETLGLTEEEQLEIKDLVKSKYLTLRVHQKSRTNKIVFYTSVAVLFLAIAYFIFYLPTRNIVDNIFWISISGTIIICLAAYTAWVRYKSWDKEELAKNPDAPFNYAMFFQFFLALGAIPGVIFYFVISWSIGNGAEEILRKTKIQTTGIIVAGEHTESRSLRGRRSEHSEVTVQFVTKEGRTISRELEISRSEFQSLYQGQEVGLIYSSENPRNVKLLTSAGSKKEFAHSAERRIEVRDLLRIWKVNNNEMIDTLNAINYGWKLGDTANMWINESNQTAIKKKQDEIIFVGPSDYDYYMEKELDHAEYEWINKPAKKRIMGTAVSIYTTPKFFITRQILVKNATPSNTVIRVSPKG